MTAIVVRLVLTLFVSASVQNIQAEWSPRYDSCQVSCRASRSPKQSQKVISIAAAECFHQASEATILILLVSLIQYTLSGTHPAEAVFMSEHGLAYSSSGCM
jgi:hypothetical protein